jgi:hypothetical protein
VNLAAFLLVLDRGARKMLQRTIHAVILEGFLIEIIKKKHLNYTIKMFFFDRNAGFEIL